jgi:peptidyl-prolyl cis-trans isomerase SurA
MKMMIPSSTRFTSPLKWLTLAIAASTYSVSFAEPVALDGVAAIVNDDVVLDSELNQRTEMIVEQLRARGQRIPPANILNTQVMDRLVLDNLLLQLADQQGIRVTDNQLNEAIQSIAARNGLTVQQFRQALIAEGRDYVSAREQIRREMLINQVQQSNVSRRIRVSDQEVQNFLKSDPSALSQPELLLSFILVDIPEQATPDQIQQSEAKANALFDTLKDGADFAETAIAASSAPNALNGGDLGWRRASELPEDIASALKGLEPGQISAPVRSPSGFYIVQLRDKRGGDVQMVNQTKVRHILLKPSEIRSPEQTKRLIDSVYRRLQGGENFTELAKELSDDLGSGSEGGELGWAQPGQMVPEFEQVMNSTPVNQISQPFESRFGWHILQVEDRRQQDMSDQILENQARSLLTKRKFNEELANWLREIRSEAYVEVK